MLKQLVLLIDVSVSHWSPQRFSFPFAQQIGEDSPCSSPHTGPSTCGARVGTLLWPSTLSPLAPWPPLTLLSVRGALASALRIPPLQDLCGDRLEDFSSVQFSRSVVSDSATPWIAACQTSLSITNSQSSLRLTSIESVMPSSHLILCRPLLLLSPIPPSIRVFSNESTLCMRWPKYWSFSFSIIPSKEIPGLISFRMDWLDLFAVQGTLKSLLQHHSSKASILWRSAFFTVPLSHLYMTTGKTIALTRRTFVELQNGNILIWSLSLHLLTEILL